MKKFFEDPMVMVEVFKIEDIITTSGETGGIGGDNETDDMV